jgi:hypothetical protein
MLRLYHYYAGGPVLCGSLPQLSSKTKYKLGIEEQASIHNTGPNS